MALVRDDATLDYISARRKAWSAYLDEQMRLALQEPEPPPLPPRRPTQPKERTPEQIGMAREIARGLARGYAQFAGSIGTSLKVAGWALDSDTLRDFGTGVAQFWSEQEQAFAPSPAAQGSLWDNPALILSPQWVAASVAETVPSLLAALVPAAGAYGAALRIGPKLLPYTEKTILGLARIGAAATGGAVGGFLEGASTFEHVKGQGGSDEDAVKAMALMGLAAAGLNALPIAKILGEGQTAIRKGIRTGFYEALTEWAEEPTEALILGEDVLQAMRQGLNVVPASFLLGGVAGAATAGPRRAPAGAPVPAPVQVTPGAPAVPAAPLAPGAEPAPSPGAPTAPQAPVAPQAQPAPAGAVLEATPPVPAPVTPAAAPVPRETPAEITPPIRPPSAEAQAFAGAVRPQGSQATIRVPAGPRYPATYELVEAEDLITSHDAQSFAVNPNYPEGVQNRPYHSDPAEQAKVIRQTQDFEPLFLLSPVPSAGGTPIVAPGANFVLSGNSRTMTLKRLVGTPDFERYRGELARLAPVFGLDPGQVGAMRNPVLVRRLRGLEDSPEAYRAFARQTNEGFTQALNLEAAAVSQGGALSRETLGWIAAGIDRLGEGATLADFLRAGQDQELIRRLVADGVFTERDLNRWVDTRSGRFNEDGRRMIGRAILGSTIPDPDLLQVAPDSALDKIGKSLGALAQIRAAGAPWDLSPDLTEALGTVTEVRAREAGSVAALRQQAGLFGEEPVNPRADALAEALLERKPTDFRRAMDRYAEAATEGASGQLRLTGERLTPGQAFSEAFGVDVGEPAMMASAISEAGMPSARMVSGEAGIPSIRKSPTVISEGTQPPAPVQTSMVTGPGDVGGATGLARTPPSRRGLSRRVGTVDLASGFTILQPSNDVEELLQLAEAARGEADTLLRTVTAQVDRGANFVGLRVKGRERALEKIRVKRRQPDTFPDYLAARISVADVTETDRVLAALDAAGFPIVRSENFLNTPDGTGYRAHHAQILLTNGLSLELQLTPHELALAQEEAHRAYEQLRRPGVSDVEYQAAAAESAMIYNRAWEAYLQRRAAERPIAGGAGPVLPPGPPVAGAPPAAPGPAPLPQGPGAAMELRLNLERLDAPVSVRALSGAINRLNSERLAQDRERKPHDVTVAGARRLGLTVQQALAWEPGRPLTEEEAYALRSLSLTANAQLEQIMTRVEQGDRTAEWDFWPAFVVAGELDLRRESSVRRFARGLEIQREPAEILPTFRLGDVGELVEALRGENRLPVSAVVARLRVLSDEQRRLMSRQAVRHARAGVGDALYELWINGLLSGPQTHVVNFASNTLTAVWAVPERWLAAELHRGPELGVVRGEAAAMWRGLIEGFMDGFRLLAGQSLDVHSPLGRAWDVLRTGQDPTGTKFDLREPAFTAGAFGQAGDTSVGQAINLLGQGIRVPTRLLMSTDAFFKGIAYRMEVKALALREATLEGHTGEALARRVAELERNPSPQAKRRADDFALLQTFQNEMGGLGQAILQAREAAPILRLILPFVRTPLNIGKWVVERTPGLNLLSSEFRADLQAPGARGDLARAKMGLGALTLSSFAVLAASGFLTGSGPSDPDLRRQLRDTGWQPYSIKVGDTYYSFNRLDPIGAMLGLVADTVEILGQTPEWQAHELALVAALALSKNITSKTYLEGLASVMEAIQSPDRSWGKMARGWARSLVPTGLRTLERTLDPELREARGVLDEIRAGIPGWSAGLPPRRNLFGEPIRLGGGLGPDFLSPVYTSPERQDPVADELVRQQVKLSMPGRVLFGRRPPDPRLQPESAREGVELTPEQYDRYLRLAGNDLKDPVHGRGMKEALAELIASPAYQEQSEGPDGGRALMITRVVHRYREAARRQLILETPQLRQALEERTIRRAEALIPGLGR